MVAIWQNTFLDALCAGQTVTEAAKAAGISKQAAYRARRRDPEFAAAWEQAYATGVAKQQAAEAAWQARFLDALRAGWSIRRATVLAGVSPSRIALARQRDLDFARAWDEALANRYGKPARPAPRAHRQLPPLTEEIITRFWSQVDDSGDPAACWLWRGRQEKGWGRFSIAGEYYQAQRVAYELSYGGPIPERYVVIPDCGNRACVNPDHVVLEEPSMPRPTRGNAHPQAKLTEEAVLDIRQRYATGQESQAVLSQTYGVSESVIRRIVHGQTWKHVGGPIVPRRIRRPRSVAEKRAARNATRRAYYARNRERLLKQRRARYALRREELLARRRETAARKRAGVPKTGQEHISQQKTLERGLRTPPAVHTTAPPAPPKQAPPAPPKQTPPAPPKQAPPAPPKQPSPAAPKRQTPAPQPVLQQQHPVVPQLASSPDPEGELQGWQAVFIRAIRSGAIPERAAQMAGVPLFMVYGARRLDRSFAAAWEAAEEQLRQLSAT